MTVGWRRYTLLAVVSVASFAGTADRVIAASGSKARARGAVRHTIFRDGFGSESFSAWSQVQVGGDGKAIVQSAIVKTAPLAAELAESANSGSRADLRKVLRGAYMDVTATGDFRILQQGTSGAPLIKLLDARSQRIATVVRRGASINLFYGRGRFSSARLALNRWATIALHVIVRGRHSTVEVRMNRRLIYRTRRARLGSGVSIVQIGNDVAAQPFAIVADEISVQAVGSPRRSPPINTAPPAISGTLQARQTVAASSGSWGGTPVRRYAYRWLRCNSRGPGCATIAGASGVRYGVTDADVGHRLRVVVSAGNSMGWARSASDASTVVQSAFAPPRVVTLPTISGTAQDGHLVNANPGGWSGTQPMRFAYQWMRCDVSGGGCGAIAGATSASYLVGSVDVGDTLRVVVSAANAVGSAGAFSAPTATVQKAPARSTIVALWHMDERSGSTMLDSMGHYNGTLYHVQLGLPGVSGTAYGFNGSSSYASVPSASSLNPGSASVTITIHLQTTGTPPPPPADWDVIRKGLYTSAGTEFKMEFQQSGQASCGFEGSGGYSELVAGPAINNGQWHTVQCAKTSSAIAVIVDGVMYAQSASVGSISNSAPVAIGARPGSDWYHGALDEASLQIG
jgi:Concanavalin A-like lectin/glucanases superfamily